MKTRHQPDDPFPQGDEMWSVLGLGQQGERIERDRTERLVSGVMGFVARETAVLTRVNFRGAAIWGSLVGVAAALVVSGAALMFASSNGVNAEVNALASLAEVHGIDLGGGDQFLIANLDELLETDVHALWLETSVR
jgi:hypothetical protein